MKRFIIFIIFVLAALGVFIVGQNANHDQPKADTNQPIDESHIEVFKVLDSGSFELLGGQKVRLIGVDSGGDISSLTNLVEKRFVTMKKDVTDIEDGYLMRYVWLGDGTFINEKLIRDGDASYKSSPPNNKYSDLFQQAEIDARNNNRGMWRKQLEVSPSDWRRADLRSEGLTKM